MKLKPHTPEAIHFVSWPSQFAEAIFRTPLHGVCGANVFPVGFSEDRSYGQSLGNLLAQKFRGAEPQTRGGESMLVEPGETAPPLNCEVCLHILGDAEGEHKTHPRTVPRRFFANAAGVAVFALTGLVTATATAALIVSLVPLNTSSAGSLLIAAASVTALYIVYLAVVARAATQPRRSR